MQVDEYRPDTGRYLLRYDDGDSDWVNLDQEKLDWGGGALGTLGGAWAFLCCLPFLPAGCVAQCAAALPAPFHQPAVATSRSAWNMARSSSRLTAASKVPAGCLACW